jgi:hypothetical protein
MIADKDRSGYIGASDTVYVMRNWNTKTFEKWWRIKQGLTDSNFCNEAMQAGTAYEHKILDALGIPGLEKDRQIIRGRLRVNLDGNTPWKIYEIKTHNADKEFVVSPAYRMQVNVEMYASEIYEACIVSYALLPEDYKNFYRDIDPDRLNQHEIEYDEDFICRYERRMLYLSRCLEEGIFPVEGGELL